MKNSEKKHLSEKEIQEIEHQREKKFFRQGAVWIFWFIALICYGIAYEAHNLLWLFTIVVLLFPIWFAGDKKLKESTFKNMITRCKLARKEYKFRTILTGILFVILFFPLLFAMIGNISKHTEEVKQQKIITNTPQPTIEILSEKGDLGEVSEYKLVYKTSDANIVKVNGNQFSGDNQEHSIIIPMETIAVNIQIKAENEYKSDEYNFTVSRNMTNEEIKVKEEEEKIRAEQLVQQKLDELDELSKEIKDPFIYTSVPLIVAVLDDIDGFWKDLKPYINNDNQKVSKKANEVKNQIIKMQKTEFPKLRKEYCSIFRDEMRRNNVDVKCNGTTISFIGGVFASNANIEDSYTIIREMLYNLRFKQARFYWYNGSDYTYYTITSLKDGDLE